MGEFFSPLNSSQLHMHIAHTHILELQLFREYFTYLFIQYEQFNLWNEWNLFCMQFLKLMFIKAKCIIQFVGARKISLKIWERHRPLCCVTMQFLIVKMLEYHLVFSFYSSKFNVHVSIRCKVHLNPSIAFLLLFIQFDMENVDNVANNFQCIFPV